MGEGIEYWELVVVTGRRGCWLARWDDFRTFRYSEKVCDLVGGFI